MHVLVLGLRVGDVNRMAAFNAVLRCAVVVSPVNTTAPDSDPAAAAAAVGVDDDDGSRTDVIASRPRHLLFVNLRPFKLV